MKTAKTFFVLLAGVLCLAGCNKNASSTIVGSYSYKTSGTVTILLDEEEQTVGLAPEQGQMHIVRDGSGDGSVIITFNDITGNADVAHGRVDGSSVTLDSTFVKSARLADDGAFKLGTGTVNCYGGGRKYDDMLILDFEYEGEFTVGGKKSTVVSSNVHCVAQYNK